VVEIVFAAIRLSGAGSATAMVVAVRQGATLPREVHDVGNGTLRDRRLEGVGQGIARPLGSTELWHNAARRVAEANNNLRTVVGFQPLHLSSDVQWAARVDDMEEAAVCFVEDLAATSEVEKHLAASVNIPQTLPVSADEVQQHHVASESNPQTIPASRSQFKAESVVEHVQVLEVVSVQDSTSSGNQASNSHPVACPDLAPGVRGETSAVSTMDTARDDPELEQEQQQPEQEPAITASRGRVGRETFLVRSAAPRQPRSQSTKNSCPVTTVRRPRCIGSTRMSCSRSILRRSISSSNPRSETPRSEKLDLSIRGFSLPRQPMSSRGGSATERTQSGQREASERSQNGHRSATERPQSNCSVATHSPPHQARPQSACGPSRRVVVAIPEPSTSNNNDSLPLESLARAGDQLFTCAQEAVGTSSSRNTVAPPVGRQCHVSPKSRGSQEPADMLRDLERRSFAVHQAAQSLQRRREKYLKGVSRQREALRYMKDELAADGNEEVLLKPLASHSRLLQQAANEHSRQREALCDMVGAECHFRDALQRELRHPNSNLKTALTEFNAAIEASFEELAKDDRIMPKTAAWNLRVLQYAAEDEADTEMASTISTTQSSTALSSSSSTAMTDSSPSCASWSATSSTGSMTVSTWATSSAPDGVTFH